MSKYTYFIKYEIEGTISVYANSPKEGEEFIIEKVSSVIREDTSEPDNTAICRLIEVKLVEKKER